MKKPQIVMFDWDNTLATSRPAVVESMNYVLSKYGLEEWDTAKNKYRDKNKSLKGNFPNFFGDNHLTAYKEYINYYTTNALKKVTSEDNAEELITKLQDEGIVVVILSNKDHALLDKEVKSCFPNIKFDGIFGNGDFEKNKPSPIPVNEICKLYNIEKSKENVWLIGDSSQDTNCAISSEITGFLIGEGMLMDKKDIISTEKHIIKENSLLSITKHI